MKFKKNLGKHYSTKVVYYTKYVFISEYAVFFTFTKDFATEFWYGLLVNQNMKYGKKWRTCMIFSLFEQFILLTKYPTVLIKSLLFTNRSLPSILSGESSVTKSMKALIDGHVTLCHIMHRDYKGVWFGIFLNMTVSGSQVTPFHHHFWFVEARWTSWRSQKRISPIEVFLMRRLRLQL